LRGRGNVRHLFIIFSSAAERVACEKMETRRITRPRVISIPLFERNGGKKETTTRRRKRQQRAKGKRRTWTDDIFFNFKVFLLVLGKWKREREREREC
jgi:hypothetical protein